MRSSSIQALSAMPPSCKIIIGYHRDDCVISGREFFPLHLGRALGRTPCNDGLIGTKEYRWMLRNLPGDDTGEMSISEKNRDYNELTGTYWAWKNQVSLGNPSYIGVYRYNRFLSLHNSHRPEYTIPMRNWRVFLRPYLFEKKALQNLEEYDVYVPHERCFDDSLAAYWSSVIGRVNLDRLVSVVKELFPSYSTTLDTLLSDNRQICFNMVLCRTDIFSEYCQFLFTILEAHETLSSPMPKLHSLLGEILTDLFFRAKKVHLRIRHVPTILVNRTSRLPVFRTISRIVRTFVPVKWVCPPNSFPKKDTNSSSFAEGVHEVLRSIVANAPDELSHSSHAHAPTFRSRLADKLHIYAPSTEGFISPFINQVGLGNLLFSISAVYAHALRYGLNLRIPWHASVVYSGLRDFLGDKAPPSTKWGIRETLSYSEPSFSYKKIPADITRGALLGLFQSARYFADCEDRIRYIFSSFIAPKEPGSLGIHLRFGDYLSRGNLELFNVPDVPFIRQALSLTSPHPRRIVLFTDDEQLAVFLLRQALPPSDQQTIQIDHSPACEAIRRMTAMEELIISASTFAWWGAYLGQQKNVFLPAVWFKNSTSHIDSYEDIYLPHWHRIPSTPSNIPYAPHRSCVEK